MWSRPQRHLIEQNGLEGGASDIGQGVYDHLSITAWSDEPREPQHLEMVGDEILGALGDPSEIADA